MIIVLNGPLGVGKTETAWHIVHRLSPAALVDIDYVAAVEPFDHQKEPDQEYAYETAAMLVRHHLRNGYNTWL